MKVQPLFTLDDHVYTVKATSPMLEEINIYEGDTLRIAMGQAPTNGSVVLVEHQHDCYLRIFHDGFLLSRQGPPIQITSDMRIVGVVGENLSRK